MPAALAGHAGERLARPPDIVILVPRLADAQLDSLPWLRPRGRRDRSVAGRDRQNPEACAQSRRWRAAPPHGSPDAAACASAGEQLAPFLLDGGEASRSLRSSTWSADL